MVFVLALLVAKLPLPRCPLSVAPPVSIALVSPTQPAPMVSPIGAMLPRLRLCGSSSSTSGRL
eukprot:15605897-Heterocapsa_arctica.AAC.1